MICDRDMTFVSLSRTKKDGFAKEATSTNLIICVVSTNELMCCVHAFSQTAPPHQVGCPARSYHLFSPLRRRLPFDSSEDCLRVPPGFAKPIRNGQRKEHNLI